jgi:uncharacterized protein (TIGR02996 family)
VKHLNTRAGFVQALRKSPRDADLRRIFADWLTEQGQERAAQEQHRKAQQCVRFDPDFSYRKHATRHGLVLIPLCGGELVLVADPDGEATLRDPADVQAILSPADRKRGAKLTPEELDRLVRLLPTQNQLRRAFDSAPHGQDYCLLGDASEGQRGSWTGGRIRPVAARVYYVLWDGDRVELLTRAAVEALEAVGAVCPESQYDEDESEAAQRCPWCRARSSWECGHLLAALHRPAIFGPLAVDGGALARLPQRVADAFERQLAAL